MKSILFLLLLDYSGSMYQKIDSKTKYEILQNNVQGLLSSANNSIESSVLIFGSQPQKRCEDIQSFTLPTSDLANKISRIKPGEFGQTPLSAALAKAVDTTLKTSAKQIIAITDGADSCNRNPCEQLVQSNEKLARFNKKIKLVLIGYDLKSDSAAFDCFKKLKLSHIEIEFLNSQNSFDLQKKLLALAHEALADLAKNLSKLTRADKKSSKEKSHKKNKDNADDKKQASLALTQFEISGAPAEVKFSIYANNQVAKKWQGPFPILIDEGVYIVKAEMPGTRSVNLKILKGQKQIYHWADFFAEPTTGFIEKNNLLSFAWTPKESTKLIHRQVEGFYTTTLIENLTPTEKKIPFGEWSLKLISPPWLVGKVEDLTVNLQPANGAVSSQAYENKLNWVQNPDPTRRWVIEIEFNGNIERHFIQSGISQVPLLKDMKVTWLSGK